VSLLFLDSFSHTILISVLYSIMGRPDDSERETSVRCTHEENDIDTHLPQTGM
jgi:hypothetical protein